MHIQMRLVFFAAFILSGLMLKGQDSTGIAVPKRLDCDLIATVMGDTL